MFRFSFLFVTLNINIDLLPIYGQKEKKTFNGKRKTMEESLT